ncbi:hypothetical protein CMO88_03985 [Candidatus Woesearchaeota archaeon]|nr:hypothetical protein [Candidatus Woesearchaeota archaeon]|tara:strand:+ start:10687 stop:11016 length:330 start_codon:yes stop_codon:yes gene_type:complete
MYDVLTEARAKGVTQIDVVVWQNPERVVLYSSEQMTNLPGRCTDLEQVSKDVTALREEGIEVRLLGGLKDVRERYAANPDADEAVMNFMAWQQSNIVSLTPDEIDEINK